MSKENPKNDMKSVTSDHKQSNSDRPRRRLQDNIESRDPTLHLNLDRRLKNHERRSNFDAEYEGPSRRLTIDRRLATRGRRQTDLDSTIIL